METSNNTRPLGYWLRTTDRLLAQEFASAFEAEGISRREWMLLSALSGEAPGLAERLARHGGPSRGKKLRSLVERGWIEETDGSWQLTDDGRAAHARLGDVVAGLRARVSSAVSPEDFATTMASLEAIARELGYDEASAGPGFGQRGFGHRGFGPGFGRRGFGPGFGAGFGPDAHGHDGHRECGGPDAGHHRGRRGHHNGHRHGERAYERGFDAGFTRGQAAQG